MLKQYIDLIISINYNSFEFSQELTYRAKNIFTTTHIEVANLPAKPASLRVNYHSMCPFTVKTKYSITDEYKNIVYKAVCTYNMHKDTDSADFYVCVAMYL